MTSTMLVGDPLQSIYGWRHSLPRYWDELVKALVPQQFELTITFRGPKQAMPLINNQARRIDKDAPVLKSVVDGYQPVLVELGDQDAQHQWLAKEIKALQARGIDTDKIAILARTRKELSQTAIALRARGITVNERYRPTSINKHKIHLLALIQLACLEQRRLKSRSKHLTKADQDLATAYIENLWINVKLKAILTARLSTKPKTILSVPASSEHYNRINSLSNAIKQAAELRNVESAIQCLIDATKVVLKDRGERHHKLLLRDLADIKINARQCATLDDMDAAWFEESVPDDVKGVQMLTVHSAKGQEWDYLFLINTVNGVYPRYQSNPEAQKEEERVFFVAITRHHRQLYILQTPVPVKMIRNKFDNKSGANNPKIFDKSSPFIDAEEQGLIRKVIRY